MIITIHTFFTFFTFFKFELSTELKFEIIHSIALKPLTINIRLVCLSNKIFNFNFVMFVNKYR